MSYLLFHLLGTESDQSRQTTEKHSCVCNKDLNKCSTSLIFKEISHEITTHSRMARKLQRLNIPSALQDAE